MCSAYSFRIDKSSSVKVQERYRKGKATRKVQEPFITRTGKVRQGYEMMQKRLTTGSRKAQSQERLRKGKRMVHKRFTKCLIEIQERFRKG